MTPPQPELNSRPSKAQLIRNHVLLYKYVLLLLFPPSDLRNSNRNQFKSKLVLTCRSHQACVGTRQSLERVGPGSSGLPDQSRGPSLRVTVAPLWLADTFRGCITLMSACLMPFFDKVLSRQYEVEPKETYVNIILDLADVVGLSCDNNLTCDCFGCGHKVRYLWHHLKMRYNLNQDTPS
jgi:hypothetical protein